MSERPASAATGRPQPEATAVGGLRVFAANTRANTRTNTRANADQLTLVPVDMATKDLPAVTDDTSWEELHDVHPARLTAQRQAAA